MFTYIAVWPDLAKFRYFGMMLKHFGHFELVHLVFGKILNLLWYILNVILQIFVIVIGQMLNKSRSHLVTLLHWLQLNLLLTKELGFVPEINL